MAILNVPILKDHLRLNRLELWLSVLEFECSKCHRGVPNLRLASTEQDPEQDPDSTGISSSFPHAASLPHLKRCLCFTCILRFMCQVYLVFS